MAVLKDSGDEDRKIPDEPIVESGSKFAVANIVPTGVKADVGGWIGDATPVTNVMAQISDWVITHPNVLNAAFLNYGKDNVLYTEGYQLDQFFCKRIALRELLTSSCHNRIGAKSLRGHRSSDFPYNITGIQYACSPRPHPSA